MSFLSISKITLAVSAVLVLASAALLIFVGPRLSIEFTGGTLMEVRLPENKTKTDLEPIVAKFAPKEPLGQVSYSTIRSAAGNSVLMRMRALNNEEHVALLDQITKALPGTTELQFNTIGPSVSASLKQKSLIALAIASVALICYLAFSFRSMPSKLSPWKFGTLAVVAFIHDIIITAGIFVIISRYTSFELDTLFVTALLTILAYSANDTIVIFDRIRANVLANPREPIPTAVVEGLRQCITRTTHTTMAGLIMLFALFFLGSESIKWFILALIVGTIIGTYSSYFIAAPLLIYWRNK
jgi:preprotein translocase subunit SecF